MPDRSPGRAGGEGKARGDDRRRGRGHATSARRRIAAPGAAAVAARQAAAPLPADLPKIARRGSISGACA